MCRLVCDNAIRLESSRVSGSCTTWKGTARQEERDLVARRAARRGNHATQVEGSRDAQREREASRLAELRVAIRMPQNLVQDT